MRLRDELVERVGDRAALRRDATGQDVEEKQRPCGHPAVKVAGRSRAPIVGREGFAGVGDKVSHVDDFLRRHTGFRLGELGRVLGVRLFEPDQEVLERG